MLVLCHVNLLFEAASTAKCSDITITLFPNSLCLDMQGVGKSCLVLRYVKGLFESASRVTVGAAFLAHSVSLPDGRTVKFEIW